ncbi:MAG: hypothetical protein ACK56I_01000, partial [bacterium]
GGQGQAVGPAAPRHVEAHRDVELGRADRGGRLEGRAGLVAVRGRQLHPAVCRVPDRRAAHRPGGDVELICGVALVLADRDRGLRGGPAGVGDGGRELVGAGAALDALPAGRG